MAVSLPYETLQHDWSKQIVFLQLAGVRTDSCVYGMGGWVLSVTQSRVSLPDMSLLFLLPSCHPPASYRLPSATMSRREAMTAPQVPTGTPTAGVNATAPPGPGPKDEAFSKLKNKFMNELKKIPREQPFAASVSVPDLTARV